MPALCSILNSACYANNYAGIFGTGPVMILARSRLPWLLSEEPKELTLEMP